MKLIKPYYEILTPINGDEILKTIERVARTCYKSEDKINEDSTQKIIKSLIEKHHEAMIEFYDIIVKFICDRGVSHEIVRHRLASYAQESTRYCNYSKKGMTFIQPTFWNEVDGVSSKTFNNQDMLLNWQCSMECSELAYKNLIRLGATPQEARSVLPNSLKTEIICTANIREWRHILKLRTSKAAHPQMRALMLPLLHELQDELPALFGDINI